MHKEKVLLVNHIQQIKNLLFKVLIQQLSHYSHKNINTSKSYSTSSDHLMIRCGKEVAISDEIVSGVGEEDIKNVRLLWADCAGVRRCRVVPYKRLDALGIGIAKVVLFLPSQADIPPNDPAAIPVGDVRLVSHGLKLKRLPWRPTDTIVVADHYQYNHAEQKFERWDFCPRNILSKVQNQLRVKHGYALRVGFELEFNLFHRPSPGQVGLPAPVDQSVYCQSTSVERISSFMDEVLDSLESLGISGDQFHAESAPGQFEIAFAYYDDAMEAADALLLAKETISAIAYKHGFIASFLPKLFPFAAGNGCHCHFSLRDKQGSVTVDDNGHPTGAGGHFVAGILKHLPGLLAFTSPSPNSYRRLQPSTWSGAYLCWGAFNKEAPLRLCGVQGRFETYNWELKAVDATANPHLMLSALMVAGMMGLEEQAELPPEVAVDPSSLSPDSMEMEGITRLPESLAAAMDALRSDTLLYNGIGEAFGTDVFLRAYLAVKDSEYQHFEGTVSSSREDILEREVLALYDRY